jgi:trigger factor
MTDQSQPSAPEISETAKEPQAEGTPLTGSAGETAVAEAPAEEKPEKLVQTVEMTDIGPCKKHVKVTVDRACIDARLKEKFSELVKDAFVPGFRKGKAPHRVVEKQFHKEVSNQVRTEVLMASLQQLGEENDIAPLSEPDLHPEQIEIPKEGPLIYEFDVEVRPQFDLPNYKGLKLRRPVRHFTEADVDRGIKRLLAPYGQRVPKDGPVELDDYITADVTTRAGDRVLGSTKEALIQVGPQLVFRDGVAERFGEQVVGARAGETRQVDLTLSDRVAEPELRGQTVQALFEIKDVKQLRLPELTHELLHEFGVHTEAQLRERVLRALEMQLEYQQRQSASQQVLEQIAESATWELPQDLLMRHTQRAMKRRLLQMREAGLTEDEIRGRLRLLEQDTLRSTAQALKESFVLQKIAEVEKIDVSEAEIQSAIESLADRTGESPRRVRARLEKEGLLEQLAVELIERKVLDLILANAEYEDVPLDQPVAGTVSTVEEQVVPGELHDPAAGSQESAETPSASEGKQ